MPSEIKGAFQIDYAGVEALDGQGWTSRVTIYGPCSNPMHRTIVFEEQRVLVDQVFASEQEAEQKALQAGLELLPK
ncbi:MAG: hypothetical protein ACRYGK_01785 [Janthinobacterium lividum]